jgi:quercetin dioxygenase-like cupin family protein
MNRYIAFALATVGLLATTGALAAAEKGVVSPASEMKWADNPALPGAKQTVLWGDPKTGGYGAVKKVPAGTMLGLHIHAHDHKAVVISGTVEFNFEGEPKKDLGAGSYVSIPGGAAHDVTCKAGAECVYFEESAFAADFKPATKK